MGRPKPSLPFGPETMLQRVVRLVAEAVRPVVVVESAPDIAGETVPGTVSRGVVYVSDRRPGRGPLEGIAVGLAALGPETELAFVTACDAPLLRPALVRRLVELAAGYDIVVPHVEGYDHPLSAVYCTRVLPHVESLLAAGRLRPAFLFDLVRTRHVTAEELTDVDPGLQSLMNLNTPTDYAAALERAGFERT
jgi:molybdenum cofactor guanylyltransferase